MEVFRKNIGIIPDNEERYFSLLTSVVESVDEYSTMLIIRNPKNYQFKISPSAGIYIPIIIREVNNLNKLCKLKVDFSKSMKNSTSVDFSLSL